MVSFEEVAETVVELFRKAETELPEDVIQALKNAYEQEDNEVARNTIGAILRNIEAARGLKVPMCQDTGLPIIFAEVGRDLRLDFNLRDAIVEGVRRATKEVPLRPNAVHPLTRENPGTNIGPHVPLITMDVVEGDALKLTVLPKGAGSENVSALRMLLPSQVNNVERFIIEVVKNAGGKPCPPIIVGVGIGTTFDGAAKLAKKALLRNVTSMDEFERGLLEKINSLGIGPGGLGGKTTALAVLVETGYCHTASLPVAVNIQCWANRRASAMLR
ncbi:fumarate hydratase [Geoglobus acetivorans]|uniref:Fumarate hydratase, subunit alpha n=1 Tax=Geoglobus acetivorans TaxID=565033 RepID=A0A0A7GJ07_GEOAI|nr:Fumarate hydratase, subunit alpha [Geoglobus acetivorans]